MPGISFFADKQDLSIFLARLNGDPDIAYIIPDGPLDPHEAFANRTDAWVREQGFTEPVIFSPSFVPDDGYRQRWKAVPAVQSLMDGDHSLWLIPAGPLPLISRERSGQFIPDPWNGWTEQYPPADRKKPYFAEHHAEIGLELYTRHLPYSELEVATLRFRDARWNSPNELLVVSDIGWIGETFWEMPEHLWEWWKQLEQWVAANTSRLASRSYTDSDTGELMQQIFWAFPSALQKLRAGMSYSSRGWDLTDSIHMAVPPAA